jgi:ABC-type multidrug transport system ATPase subunit
MIVADHVTRRFGRVAAVNDVSFELPPGGSLALWGSNGAGKTTLIRCLLGVIRFRGRITVGGIDVARRGKQARSLVGYVPQELAFHDDAGLLASMRFYARLHGVDVSEAPERALGSVGLLGHEKKRVRDLSGGMKQRLALAIALLADPPIVILDEPTSNLDESGRRDVVETVRRLAAGGKTVIFSSHRADEVRTLAGRVLVMERGRVLRDTTPSELWSCEAGARTLRLYLRHACEADAAAVLREAGHSVNLNGRGLCVTVAESEKAGPIHALAMAQIEVRDIEILHDPAPGEIHP